MLIERKYKDMAIAVDFDGTLCVSEFPKIIAPKLEVIEEVKKLKEEGATLVLWTCRAGEDLTDAIRFCNEYGLHFDYINENTQANIDRWKNDTRKISASYYIDDKAVNPFHMKQLEEARNTIAELKTALAAVTRLVVK